MSITLWGRESSANVQKVRWALAEIGLPYEHIPLGGKHGGNRDPAYLATHGDTHDCQAAPPHDELRKQEVHP